jgi:hypothetical protein
MTDPDDGLTRERNRRVQGGILVAMAVMTATAAVLAYSYVLGYYGGGGSSGLVNHPKSVMEVSVPRLDWPRFIDATERFAASQRLVQWSGSLAPVNESTSTFWMLFLGDHGLEMRAEIGKNGQFVVGFTDKGRSGAEQRLAAEFRTDVVDAGGFHLLP